jgi:hypothetical protein
MSTMKFKYSLLLLALTICVAANAQINTSNITTTAVPFLRVSPDARAGGMGDAGIATLPSTEAVFWNRAKLPFISQQAGMVANYNPWLKDVASDMYLASLAGFYNLKDQQSLSASLRYFNMGEVEQHDYNGTYLKTDNPREFAFDLGYSRKLSDRDGIAIAMRYINSKLLSGSVNGTQYKAGSAVAADLSFYHNGLDDNGAGWTWGATLSNLGSRVSYSDNGRKDYLPAELGIGVANTLVFNLENKLTLAADINKLLVPPVPYDSAEVAGYGDKSVAESWIQSFGDNSRLQFSLGAEYNFKELLLLRAGYYMETKNEGNNNYFTAGAGINYLSFGVNFSYLVPFNNESVRSPLSNTLRFGLVFHFDQQGNKK